MDVNSPAIAVDASAVLEPGQLLVHAHESAEKKLDRLEVEMMKHAPVECPLTHLFTRASPEGGGLYIREIFMPAGALVTSKIHKTQHPYVISKGRVSVWTEADGWITLEAPHTGITQPGTRRLLYIHEDTVWTTFHPTDETDLAVIEAAIIEKHDEHLAGLVQPPPLPPRLEPVDAEGAAP